MKARAGQIDGLYGVDILAGTKTMWAKDAGMYWFKSPDNKHPTAVQKWRRFYVGEVYVKTVILEIRHRDADGLADIVFSGRNGVGWLKNPGHKVLQSRPEAVQWERIVISHTGSEFTFCDPTGDGSEDLIIATSKQSAMVA